MQKDGLAGRVSDHIDTDRIISTRPKVHEFVRVTNFPWRSPPWEPRHDHHDEGWLEIPYGNYHEVTVWKNRGSLRDSYTASAGARRASELALQVAAEDDLPIWDSIVRLRPNTIVGPRRGDPANASVDDNWVEIEADVFETIPGDNSRVIFEREDPPNQWVSWLALHVETQVAATGETREEVLDELNDRVDRFKARPHNAGIVQSPDTLGETPRINNTRIGVLHVVYSAKRGDSLPELAANFGRELSITEIVQALDWADDHPAEIAAHKREDDLYNQWVWEYWDLDEDISEEGEFAFHTKPDDMAVSFAEFHRDAVISGFLDGDIPREEVVATLGEDLVTEVEQAHETVEDDSEWSLGDDSGE